ncbi:hypothetical protein ACSQ67_025688 [Phaseolus vulgaris]
MLLNPHTRQRWAFLTHGQPFAFEENLKVILEEEVAVLQISWDDCTRELVNKAHAAGFKVVPQVRVVLEIKLPRYIVGLLRLMILVQHTCVSRYHSGVKQSGFGRFGGAEGLRACCLVKAVVEDRWWSFIKIVIPKPLQFQESLVEALLNSAYGTFCKLG